MLAGVFVLLKAVAYYLDRYELLFSDRSPDIFTGATYTDLNAVMPAKLILLFISIICAAAFFAAVFRRNLQLPAIAVVLLVLSSVLIGAAWPQVLQQFVVAPNANEREAPSDPAQHRRHPRRRSASTTTTSLHPALRGHVGRRRPPAVAQRHGHGAEHPAARPGKLGDTFTQLQQRRTFYGFPTKLDIDRYTVDAARRRTTSSPRAS